MASTGENPVIDTLILMLTQQMTDQFAQVGLVFSDGQKQQLNAAVVRVFDAARREQPDKIAIAATFAEDCMTLLYSGLATAPQKDSDPYQRASGLFKTTGAQLFEIANKFSKASSQVAQTAANTWRATQSPGLN